MNVPFVDLKAQYVTIKAEIDAAIDDVIAETAFIGGDYVRDFEANFAQFCGARHCVGVGNGTDAIFIALKIAGIDHGDEVIVPANTFIASAEAIAMAGAKVVFVDCDPISYNIDVNIIESVITSKTRAIIPVHLYGQPVDLKAIREIADRHDLKIVQDCAQAHGAEINDKPLSSFGDLLCFSFYPGKNLGAYGDAGAIVTDDKELATRARMFANHGRISKYDHEFEGVNSRMDGLQAAILNVKLKYLPQWIKKRIKAASIYSELLNHKSDIIIPFCPDFAKHVYHLYVIRTKRRDLLKQYLNDSGVATGIHYPIALPNLQAYRRLGYRSVDLPVASQYQDEILSLPMYPELTEDQIRYVANKILEF